MVVYNPTGINCLCHCHILGCTPITSACWCNCRSQTVTVSGSTTYTHESRELKDKIIHLENLFKSKIAILEESITKLQQSREAQSRNNKNIFDLLEKYIPLIDHLYKNRDLWREGYQKLDEKIKEVERLVNAIKESYNNLCTSSLKREPHKCPVCHGEIKILIDPSIPMSGIQAMFGKRDENGMYYKDCKSCDGKGILWG